MISIKNLEEIGFKKHDQEILGYELIIFEDKIKAIKLLCYSNIKNYLDFYLEISEFEQYSPNSNKIKRNSVEVQFNDVDEILKFISHIKGKTYGTKDSNLLKAVINAGHKPIMITTMLCEETFVFETKKEAKDAWKDFEKTGEGWWYGLENNEWETALKKYADDFYDGDILKIRIDNL